MGVPNIDDFGENLLLHLSWRVSGERPLERSQNHAVPSQHQQQDECVFGTRSFCMQVVAATCFKGAQWWSGVGIKVHTFPTVAHTGVGIVD